MPPANRTSSRRKVTVADLTANKIFIHIDNELPPLMVKVRDLLLNFESAKPRMFFGVSQRDQRVESRNEIAETLLRLLGRRRKKPGEAGWQILYEDSILRMLYEMHVFDAIENPLGDIVIGSNPQQFNAAHKARDLPTGGLTAPRPDIFLAFPVQTKENPSIWSVFDHYTYQNFEYNHLLALEKEHGLCCDPLMSLREYEWLNWKSSTSRKSKKRKIPEESDKEPMCFPWAIVEIKNETHKRAELDTLNFQAANGSSACLDVFIKLAKHGKMPGLAEIPPVVAITLNGAHATVWLTCLEEDESLVLHKHMYSIWSGSLVRSSITEFVHILENLLIWGCRYVKPWVSGRLSQWQISQKPTYSQSVKPNLWDLPPSCDSDTVPQTPRERGRAAKIAKSTLESQRRCSTNSSSRTRDISAARDIPALQLPKRSPTAKRPIATSPSKSKDEGRKASFDAEPTPPSPFNTPSHTQTEPKHFTRHQGILQLRQRNLHGGMIEETYEDPEIILDNSPTPSLPRLHPDRSKSAASMDAYVQTGLKTYLNPLESYGSRSIAPIRETEEDTFIRSESELERPLALRSKDV